MSDIAIVKAMELRQRWRSLASLVPTDMLVPDAKAILSWYGVYFKTYQDKDAIDHDLLLSLIKTKAQLTQEQWVHIKQTVERLRKFDDTDAVEGIVDNLLERDLEGRAGALLEQFSNGISAIKYKYATGCSGVALLGTVLPSDIRLPSSARLFIALDGDKAGREGASCTRRALEFRGYKPVVITAPAGLDPKDLTIRQLRESLMNE